MFTLTPFLGTLPPSSLAAADLPQFITRALGRRSAADLEGLVTLLTDEQLPGYPASLAHTLRVFMELLIAEQVDPAHLDPDAVDRLLQTQGFLARLEPLVNVERQPLRPGLPVSDAVRSLVRERLQVLPGVGPQLVIVTPVEVIRVPGLGHACLRGPCMARAMDGEEAAALADTWVILEEAFGWQTAEVRPWQAAFEQIAVRANPEASAVVAGLIQLTEGARRSLWRAVTAHLRDQSVADLHRPGPKGLERRVASLVEPVEMVLVNRLMPLASAAYHAAAVDPQVEVGICPCSAEDLGWYATWPSVPTATRETLLRMGPSEVEYDLRRLAAQEAGTADVALEPQVERMLRGLRDALLRPRYRRCGEALRGIDPLVLADDAVNRGEDRSAMLEALRDLSARATDADARGRDRAPAPADAPVEPPMEPPVEPPEEPLAAQDMELGAPESGAVQLTLRSPFAPDPPAPEPPEPQGSGLDEAEPEEEEALELPPLPAPPPRRGRPVTQRGTELPPLPNVPPVRPRRASTRRHEPVSMEDLPAPPPPEPPRRSPDSPTTPAGADPGRHRTLPHLVTPAQASQFYEEAFRSLQVLERDLLEGGAPANGMRVVARLGKEAKFMADALGPAARSGDQSFQSALHKMGLVTAYLDRVSELLTAPPELDAAAPPSMFDRLGRFFRRDPNA